MSEPENFLSRWARRKREAEQEAQHEPPLESKKDAAPGAEPEAKADADTDLVVENDSAPAKAEAESFDIDSLPPLESINAATHIRDFLRPGVPADLSRAALRRAWSADPAIRDFIGLSENAWDFTDTNDILGFGPLHDGDDIRRMVAEVFGDGPKAEAPATEPQPDPVVPQHAAAQPEENEQESDPAKAGGDAATAAGSNTAALQYDRSAGVGDVQGSEETKHAALQQRRAHGRALPQ